MIYLKTDEEIKIMKEGGRILAKITKKLIKKIRPGITTKFLDDVFREEINYYNKKFLKAEIKPAFLGYKNNSLGPQGYPSSICTSVNEEIVHCIPSDRVLNEGDILSLDLGIIYKGFNLDMALTLGVGKISKEAKKLIKVTKEALNKAIKVIKPGATLGDIGFTIQSYVESQGFNVIRDLVGHGIGKKLHEEPQVPNYGISGKGMVLKPGMVIAIEPMVTTGSFEIIQDGWAIKTKDGSLSAHFEHTIAITKKGNLVLTKL